MLRAGAEIGEQLWKGRQIRALGRGLLQEAGRLLEVDCRVVSGIHLD
jgi:hypothetical protein